MIEIIVNNNKRKVVYDTEKNIYIKYFKPKLKKRIQYILKLKKFPGDNAKYISEVLKKEGIKTYNVISFSNYSFTTEKIEGISLLNYLLLNKEKSFDENNEYFNEYVEIISKFIKLGIYYTDFHLNNFLVSNEELYIIDIDEAQKNLYSKIFKNKNLLENIKNEMIKKEKEYKNNLEFNTEKIFSLILKKVNKN